MSATDPNLELLSLGVSAAAELIIPDLSDEQLQESLERWKTFETQARVPDEAIPLTKLVERFGLDSFELKILMLALGAHVEPRLHALVSRHGREVFARAISVRLVVERFCRTGAEKLEARNTFLPSSRLLRNRLIRLGASEVGASEGVLARRIEMTTPTVRHLLRETELSDTVAGLVRLERPDVNLLNVILPPAPLKQVRELVEQHSRYRELITEWGFDRVLPYGRGLSMLFSGPSGTGKTLLAQAISAHVERPLMSLSAADLPEREGIDVTLRDLFAEANMRDAIVLIDECEALFAKQDKRKASAFKAIEDFDGILVLITNHPEMLDEALERRIIYHLPFEQPDSQLRRQIWEVHIPPEVPLEGDIDLDILANRYDFTGGLIKNAILMAVNRALAIDSNKPKLTMELLEEGCRSQLRYALEELTTRTTTHLRLKDIVLPDDQKKKVREIIAAIRNQSIVLNKWGFGRKLVTGKGITCLFDGPPGTGKTLCSEIIAGEFDRPLYRVNLPEVVSKWVGETEKHIKQIFQQATLSHAMLLFDEADSLFSARSAETKSATDRYANMEVNLLLQEIERFPGVVILTTNFFGSLDRALVRRIQFRVTFEEPDVEQREMIWMTLCPSEAPLSADVDWTALAKQYEMTGGMIKNALLRAAYLACDEGSDITLKILKEACRDEYKAAGKLARDPDYVPPPSPYLDEVIVEDPDAPGPKGGGGVGNVTTVPPGQVPGRPAVGKGK